MRILTYIAMLFAVSAMGATTNITRTVNVNTNNVLFGYSTNLFSANSNALNAAVAHPTNGLATLSEVTNLVAAATNFHTIIVSNRLNVSNIVTSGTGFLNMWITVGNALRFDVGGDVFMDVGGSFFLDADSWSITGYGEMLGLTATNTSTFKDSVNVNTNLNTYNLVVTNAATAASFTGDGAGLTNALGAVDQFQFVTLAQLESYLGAGQHMWFYGSSNIAGAMNVGATVTTNWAYSTASTGAVVTNTYAAVTNGQYLASYVSADTFRNIISGSVVGEIYAYKGVAGSAAIKMEVYLFDTVGGTNIYEFEPSPAYQTLTTTKTVYRFSIPTIDYSYATDLRVVAKIKAQAGIPAPTIYLSTEGADNSHAAITVPDRHSGVTGDYAILVAGGLTNLFQFSSGLLTNVDISYP